VILHGGDDNFHAWEGSACRCATSKVSCAATWQAT
jgi:hypothetical protein